jgi:integrase
MGKQYVGVRASSETTTEITFIYNGKRCRERLKLKPTAANLDKAHKHRQSILAAIDAGLFDYAVTFPDSKRAPQFSDKPDITVNDWLETWLTRKEKHLKSSTYAGYVKAINQLTAALGSIALADLKKKDVRAWCDSKAATNKTLANLVSVLRAALQDAADDEIIPTNPLFDFKYRRQEPPRVSDVDPFTRDEQAAILAVLSDQHLNLFQFAFWSGLRTSELVALQWGDIDWLRGTVLVQRAKTQPSSKAETTKTKAGNREVKLLPPALAALTAQKQFTFLHDQTIFHNPKTGQPWQGDQAIRKFWTFALKRAGVRYRRPYQTRHTYASMMLTAGEPLAWVSKQLGHSSVIMTASVYATHIPDAQPDAGNKAVELFAQFSCKTGN